MEHGHIKFVVVGDTQVGKSAFLTTWAFGSYPHEYITRVFSSWSCYWESSSGRGYTATPWDTAGGEDYSKLNALSYPQTDLFIYTYSVTDLASFEHVMDWVKETRQHCPDALCVLFALKRDMRDNLKPGDNSSQFVTYNQGKELAAIIGAKAFFELSALKDPSETLNDAMKQSFTIVANHLENTKPKEDTDNELVTNVPQANEKRDPSGRGLISVINEGLALERILFSIGAPLC